MIKKYYWLAKPGIIYGNNITAAAGFFLAARGQIDWLLFLAAIAGISFIMGSGCTLNNVLDRDIDARMDRTKNRSVVTGEISKRNAIIYGVMLGIIGSVTLAVFTNLLTLAVALIGWVFYVAFYTPLKRLSVHGTLVGAIAGAVPPVVGYCAVTNQFDKAALILFLILVFWQMPHFYAIAIHRLKDYTAASIPVLPIKNGMRTTKIQMLVYVLGFIAATQLLTYYGYTGKIYSIIAGLLGLIWLVLSLQGFKSKIDNQLWAKKIFRFSLIVLTTLSMTISIGGIIYQ